jgi:hypothetical protein
MDLIPWLCGLRIPVLQNDRSAGTLDERASIRGNGNIRTFSAAAERRAFYASALVILNVFV